MSSALRNACALTVDMLVATGVTSLVDGTGAGAFPAASEYTDALGGADLSGAAAAALSTVAAADAAHLFEMTHAMLLAKSQYPEGRQVPLVWFDVHERYLRAPGPGERACARADNPHEPCEGTRIAHWDRPLVEYTHDCELGGAGCGHARLLCLLCKRALEDTLAVSADAANSRFAVAHEAPSATPSCALNTHTVPVGVANGYNPACVIQAHASEPPLPISGALVRYDRGDYVPSEDGTRLTQEALRFLRASVGSPARNTPLAGAGTSLRPY